MAPALLTWPLRGLKLWPYFASQIKGSDYMRLSWKTRLAPALPNSPKTGKTQAMKRDRPSFSTTTFFKIFGVPVRRVAAFEEPV